MEFKDTLRELRKKKGLSQVELAEKLGFSKSLIGLYETGDRKPSFKALGAIADIFNISTDYLMGKDDERIYYLDPEAAEIAQEIHERPELRNLFAAGRKISKADLQLVLDMLERLK